MSAGGGQDLFSSEQFRMARLQVYNWGTFDGVHDIPISERGFLFVGPSGAGKSTLLDAISALLVPPRWIAFNAAAREDAKGSRDRNLVSYIRGAWAEQKDDSSGEIATRYLRGGTTWSALALTYANGLGQCVVLVQIFWLRGGAGGMGDVRRHFMVLQRPFDLGELDQFGQTDLDVRKLKASITDADHRSEFRPYCERFSRLLGIENEMALRLLHKTQSAKSLGDLNTLLRDFMLDRPETFDAADRLVDEFGELNAAHRAVVTAREQVDTLKPALQKHRERESLLEEREALAELLAGIDSYGAQRRIDLLTRQIESLRVKAEGLKGEISRKEAELGRHKDSLGELERRHRDAGGGQVEALRKEKASVEQQRQRCQEKQAQAREACRQLDFAVPDTPHRFAELVGEARQEIERWRSGSDGIQERRDDLVIRQKDAKAEHEQAAAELKALERQPSNIPAEMLELRSELASGIGVSEISLPFVGELVEVRKEDSEWRGAIERVLRGFALSLLVEDRHYASLADHVNSRRLRGRLVYYRTGQAGGEQTRPVGSDSLVLKLNLDHKRGQSEWLRAELRRRFDFACVDSMQAFRRAERALTREGQVKHSKVRHEKDDRRDVGDRRHWTLGFDNSEKRALYREQVRELADRLADLQGKIRELDKQQETRAARAIHCQTLVNLQWEEVDLAPLLKRVDDLERRIRDALEGNRELKDIAGQIGRQEKAVADAEAALRKTTVQHDKAVDQIAGSEEELRKTREDPNVDSLTSSQRQGLDERFGKLRDPLRLDNLDRAKGLVERSIREETTKIERSMGECQRLIERQFGLFVSGWPAESEGLDASLAAAPDFFAKLTRLETDGLPAHERRFFELLESQSEQNLAALSTHLSNARKEIMERMELVNLSLEAVPFNRSEGRNTYLRIQPSERQLPEVREFRQEIKKALDRAWGDDRDRAEARFVVLRGLVERLSSQETDDKRWRLAVLDVRQHMEFIGIEADESGVEVEVYRGGSGKSGGQRQKLATTCLAAALRYQLGGQRHGMPMYAAVVLDEAFEKADAEFTEIAMNIFESFGFQVIMATPLKSVMTLEKFIGGACFIDIKDRRRSGILMIEYDEEGRRLELPAPERQEASLEAP